MSPIALWPLGDRSSRPLTSTRSNADGKKSGRGSTQTRRDLEGCRGHFSTLSPSSRPLTSTRSDTDKKFSPPDVDERHFSTLNLGNNVAKESISTSTREARVFLTLAADKRLAADKESKGLWAPNVDERHFSRLNADGGSDWWEDLAEKEREKFQSLAVRSNAIALWPLEV
jgi:hypothetical protein